MTELTAGAKPTTNTTLIGHYANRKMINVLLKNRQNELTADGQLEPVLYTIPYRLRALSRP